MPPEVLLSSEVSVTVMTSPGLKSVVGLNTTEVVPPPEKVPDIIPVFFPVITILVAFKVEVLIGVSKVNVISESKDTVFDAVAGVEEAKFKGVAVLYQAMVLSFLEAEIISMSPSPSISAAKTDEGPLTDVSISAAIKTGEFVAAFLVVKLMV